MLQTALAMLSGINLKELGTPALIFLGSIAALFFIKSFFPNPDEIRNQAIVDCNNAQLEQELAREKELRLNAEELAESLRGQLRQSIDDRAESERFVRDLDSQLNDLNLEDGEISERTKELVRRLNERTEGMDKTNVEEVPL